MRADYRTALETLRGGNKRCCSATANSGIEDLALPFLLTARTRPVRGVVGTARSRETRHGLPGRSQTHKTEASTASPRPVPRRGG